LAAPDPAIAASAWLARIPPAQLAAADAFTNTRLVGWAVGGAVFLALCLLLARTGALARLQGAIEVGRPRPWLSAAAAAGALTFVLGAAGAMVSGVCAWRGDELLARGGGTPPAAGLAAHLAQAAAGLIPSVLAAVLLVPSLFWLMRRRPRSWPLVAGALLMAGILGLGWLPYALSAGPPLGPAPPGPAQDGVMRLVAETGLPVQAVLASPDPTFDADVTGGFGRAKVVLGPQMLAGPPAEARAFVGHVMGHYVHNDILIACLIFAGVLAAGLFAVPPWGASLARWLGAGAVSSPAEPAALPALAVMGFLAATLAALAGSAYLRAANVGADAYSLDHAREPDGLAAVIVREWDHQSVDPTPIEAAIFYTHPPLEGRLVHAMAWKAAHGG
jgi:STE24 endopeptidase